MEDILDKYDIIAEIFKHIFSDFVRREFSCIVFNESSDSSDSNDDKIDWSLRLNVDRLQGIKYLLRSYKFLHLICIRKVCRTFKHVFDAFIKGGTYNYLIKDLRVIFSKSSGRKSRENDKRFCIISLDKIIDKYDKDSSEEEIMSKFGREYLDFYERIYHSSSYSKMVIEYFNLEKDSMNFSIFSSVEIFDIGRVEIKVNNRSRGPCLLLKINTTSFQLGEYRFLEESDEFTDSIEPITCIDKEMDFMKVVNPASIIYLIKNIDILNEVTTSYNYPPCGENTVAIHEILRYELQRFNLNEEANYKTLTGIYLNIIDKYFSSPAGSEKNIRSSDLAVQYIEDYIVSRANN